MTEVSKKLVFKMEGKNQVQKEAVFFALKQAGYHWFDRSINTIDDPTIAYSVLCIYPSDKEITHWTLDKAIETKHPIFEDLETLYMICDFTIQPDKYNKQVTGMERLEKLIKNTNYGKVTNGQYGVKPIEIHMPKVKAPILPDFNGKVKGSLHEELKKIEPVDVVHQDHYKNQDIEPIDYMRQTFTTDEFRGFLQGNCVKYLARHKDKNGLEDLKKAKVYLQWLIEEWEEEV